MLFLHNNEKHHFFSDNNTLVKDNVTIVCANRQFLISVLFKKTVVYTHHPEY